MLYIFHYILYYAIYIYIYIYIYYYILCIISSILHIMCYICSIKLKHSYTVYVVILKCILLQIISKAISKTDTVSCSGRLNLALLVLGAA